MNYNQLFLTRNECFRRHVRHEVKGIMLHSTGADNPRLSRYIQPNDGKLGENRHGNHWNVRYPDSRRVCPHAFIGRLADGTVATYQVLPWDIVGWHSGSGKKGSANRLGYIGIEICEDSLRDGGYLAEVYREAAELCADLCRQYSLDPSYDIICHSEGHRLGIASNHADVMHWFLRFGRDMDGFRAEVRRIEKEKSE